MKKSQNVDICGYVEKLHRNIAENNEKSENFFPKYNSTYNVVSVLLIIFAFQNSRKSKR